MEISRVACIGAGACGTRDGRLSFLSRGLEVIIQDINQEILNESMKQIWLNLKFFRKPTALCKREVLNLGGKR